MLAGVEYRPVGRHYFSGRAGMVMNYPVPVLVGVDEFGSYRHLREFLAQVQVHRTWSKSSIGVGVHWISMEYTSGCWPVGYCKPEQSPEEELSLWAHSLGPVISGERWYSDSFSLGLTYLPTILLSTARGIHFRYSHTIYFGVTVKVATISL
jgi:hypothetical protein